MTTTMSSERRAAVRALGRFLATSAGREHMARNGYVNGTPIVAAHESEPCSSVIARLEAHGGKPAAFAVHYPARPDPLVFLHVKPGTDLPNPISTGGDSTIGMLADAITQGSKVTVRVQMEAGVTAFEFAR